MEERRFSAALREKNAGLQPPWNIPSLDAYGGRTPSSAPRRRSRASEGEIVRAPKDEPRFPHHATACQEKIPGHTARSLKLGCVATQREAQSRAHLIHSCGTQHPTR